MAKEVSSAIEIGQTVQQNNDEPILIKDEPANVHSGENIKMPMLTKFKDKLLTKVTTDKVMKMEIALRVYRFFLQIFWW